MTDLDSEAIHYYVDEVIDIHKDYMSTHYAECWKYHVACLAAHIKYVLEDDKPK